MLSKTDFVPFLIFSPPKQVPLEKNSVHFPGKNGIIFSIDLPLISPFPNPKISFSKNLTVPWLFSSIHLKFPLSRSSSVTLVVGIPKASLLWGITGRLGLGVGVGLGFRGWIKVWACTDNSRLRLSEVPSRAKRRKRSRITMWMWATRFGLWERSFPRSFTGSSVMISIGMMFYFYFFNFILCLLHLQSTCFVENWGK